MSNSQNKTLILSTEDSVRNFIVDIGLPLVKASEGLGVSSDDFMKWWAGTAPRTIKDKQLLSLAQYFTIDENQIINKSYDKNFVRSQFLTGSKLLPEKYAKNKFSYLRSSAHIIKFLNLTRGQAFSDMILRKMNVFPLIYDDLNNRISLNYFMDLLDTLAENGLTQIELDSLCCMLFLTLQHTPLGEKFRKARTYFECYEVVANNVHLFDNNFVYSFDLDNRGIKIQAFLQYESHTHIQWTQGRMDRLLRYRQILVGCYAYLSNLTPIFPDYRVEVGKYEINAVYTVKFNDGPSRLFLAEASEANN